MSEIFDGLRRAEDERSVANRPAAGVTELLQRAERHAVSKWATTVLEEEPNDREIFKGTTTDEPKNVAPVIATASVELDAVDAPSLSNEHARLFQSFPSLEVISPSDSRLPCLTDSRSPAAEAFRLLGVRLRHLRRERQLKKILITSTIPQEGKSMVSANLACTMAMRTQQKILVLEGDLRRPSLSHMFGIGRNPGLCELLGERGRDLAGHLYHLQGPNIWILPAGSAPSNALELLQSGRLTILMNQLAGLFDWIIIDTPPVLPLADTSVWMRLADGILLTTRQGTTQKKLLKRGLEALEPKKIIGALVNSSNNATTGSYYYYGPPTS